MEFLHPSLYIFLLLSLLSFTNSQQIYINDTDSCGNETSRITNGFLCNGVNVSCDSYVTFRSVSPYDSPSAIASLFALDPREIAKINNIHLFDKIPNDTLITVPVSCSCSGDFYQHHTTYTMIAGDTPYFIAGTTYQGLTTCQAMLRLNPSSGYFLIGMKLIVPLRCACPSRNQTEIGVRFLLTYPISRRDTIYKISKHFGVDMQSIFSANSILNSDKIIPFTTILVPLRNQSCTAAPAGSYLCYCNPAGYIREWREDDPRCRLGTKTSSMKSAILTGFGIGGGLLITVLASSWVYRYMKRRKKRKRKEKLFKQNGGLLLQQRISSSNCSVGKSTVFTEEELEKATNNFSEDRILGRGGFGTVYKGMLSDGSIVAIKKCNSKVVDESQVEQFINEVVILSQINHRNVVKLLGCCLESEVPILVYEYVPNGTLFDYIHKEENKASSGSFPLKERLRIAWEVAGAIAYMHSAASMPIFHRDIKSTNILLDDTYTAKVSDFGTSRSVPLDKTHLTTMVLGTFGYLDPEYFQSSQFTDKSDVYSFGVVLVELLTGQTPISFTRSQEDRNLAAHFVLSVKGNSLYEILHPCVVKEAGEEEILSTANLALRCLKRSGKKRPTMREVAMELESLRRSQLSFSIK